MPRYRIYRIKDTPRETFRWAPHTGGEITVKLKDYDVGSVVEAPTPYAAWKLTAESNKRLSPGDVLEILRTEGEAEAIAPSEASELLIVKYIGFEPARWFIPEIRKSERHGERQSLSSTPPVLQT